MSMDRVRHARKQKHKTQIDGDRQGHKAGGLEIGLGVTRDDRGQQ